MDFEFLESIILTRVKTKFDKSIKNKYPDLTFTTDSDNDSLPKFPTVYIHLLPSPETGQTLEGSSINGMIANFQIDVMDNQNKQRAKEVMAEVKRIFKTMRFRFNDMPYPEQTDGTYYSIAKASRAIGSGDTL